MYTWAGRNVGDTIKLATVIPFQKAAALLPCCLGREGRRAAFADFFSCHYGFALKNKDLTLKQIRPKPYKA